MSEPPLKRPKSGADVESKLSPVEIIVKKRDGHTLSKADITSFINAFNDGTVPDYQMSALLMAIYIRGMSLQETADLTLAMTHTGRIADLSGIAGPKVDKHSTGGVGDKVSLVLAPLAAACGLIVPMMSGRGLGHTGGTLDKLESIPGFQAFVSSERFLELLGQNGCCIVGPTEDIAPVDKKIYALRDVTGTTESLPLLCSSIMSKKIAEGPEALLLDVKVGRGAFLKEWDQSVALAEAMISAGENAGKRTVVLMTSMDQPLGLTIGNWLETREALDTLRGHGPADLQQLVCLQAAQMLALGGKVKHITDGIVAAQKALQDGSALKKFYDLVRAQGGDTSTLDNPDSYPACGHQVDITAKADGYVKEIDTLELGLCSVSLGAGREKVADTLDYSAGIVLHKKVGDAVSTGDKLATIHTNREWAVDRASARVQAAFVVSSAKPDVPVLIRAMLTRDGLLPWHDVLASKPAMQLPSGSTE